MTDERKKLLQELIKEAREVALRKEWAVTEDELIGCREMGSFEFGYACGVLALADKIIGACMNGWRVRTKYNNVLSVIKKYM